MRFHFSYVFIILFLGCHIYCWTQSHYHHSSNTLASTHKFRIHVPRSFHRYSSKQHMRRTSRYVTGKDFIDAMSRQGGDNESPLQRFTHMIAIPMERNHDLMLDLESVQRAVLYHCPLLIDSCIVPALTRLPLLLIDTRVSPIKDDIQLFETDESIQNVLTSRDRTTRALYSIIQQVVRDTIQIALDISNETDEERQRRHRDEGRNGVNSSNVKPLVISFKGLEVDGDDNDVLFAIGKEDDGTQRLRGLVIELASRIRNTYGWHVSYPPDLLAEKQQLGWRPRVPFMRLPPNFKENLPNPKGMDGEWEFYTPEEKATYIRFPEEGGNGISPIFWYKWWEDSFCSGNGIRMKELAVYGRTGPFEISETAFYIPHLKVALPDGNQKLQDDEIKAQNYEASRQDSLRKELDEKGGIRDEADIALAKIKTDADRRIIETIYASSTDASNLAAMEWSETFARMEKNCSTSMSSPSEEENNSNSIVKKNSSKPIESKDGSSRVVTKMNKPKPEDNPIFQNWRDRKTMADDTPTTRQKLLPPFPSDECFVGLWRFASSPITLNVDESDSNFITNTDPSSSETLILRVDGTTAGGPILDPVGKLKSAGGTWRVFQAEWSGQDTTSNMERTRLRIRLLVPPKKEKILVMEGEIRRGQYSSSSLQNFRELQRLSTFSVPQVEAAQGFDVDNPDESMMIYCTGEMWVEMASPTKERIRKKLGNFSLFKLSDPSPSQIRYSIPSNKPGYYE